MPEPSTPKPFAADDELDELPPMDGDDDVVAAEEEESIDDVEDGGDALDDATGEDDPVDASEIDAAGGESGWLEDADDAEGLDLGANEIASFEESGGHDPRLDFEEPGVGEEDFGIGADDGKAELDAGEEGPSAADEELREQDLPPLDADEEGDVDDAELVDAAFTPADAIPRAAQAWAPVGAPVDVGAVTAIACVARGVLVATTRGLVRVDLEGAVEALAAAGLEAPLARLVALGDAIAAVTAAGELVVSSDAGATFRSAWRERASLASGGAADVAFADGALWTRTRGGALLRSADLGVAWEAVTVGGRVAAIATDARGLAVLVVDATSERVRLVRGVGRADAMTVDVAAAEAPSGALATRGAHAACVGSDGAEGVLVADGVALARVGGVDALVFLDDDGTLLVASYREQEDATSIVRVSGQTPEIVAEVGGADVDAEADGRVRALVCDDAHGVVWVGGGFGLLALEPRGPVSSASS